MRTFTRAVVAAAAVAGAMTASGAALATAEPAGAGQAGTNVQAAGWYTGTGYGSTEYFALQNARQNAEMWARFDGYDPFFDCSVVSQFATRITDYSYTARVNLYCY